MKPGLRLFVAKLMFVAILFAWFLSGPARPDWARLGAIAATIVLCFYISIGHRSARRVSKARST